jgi:hypothetical protein
MGQHFIDAGSTVALVLDTILSAAGQNFSAPFDSETQPHDVASANNDPLIQYQLPGGAQLEGHANPGSGGSIGTAINSMLGLLSPAISAYALILPILGVIRGIIEILCCLMNPFCVISAVIRLFTKWIPPFISLFPPLAGVIIVLSTIKAIIAMVFFVLTELIPFIELMIANIKNLANFFANPDDLNDAQKDAAIDKLKSLLETLIQKLGIITVFKPLLDLIFLILTLVAGFPCSSGNAKRTNASTSSVNQSAIGFDTETDDATCCREPICPEILSDRDKTPKGTAILIPSNYGDCAPSFVFRLITGDPDVRKLEQFQESSSEQLRCQLDEPIKYARPAGGSGDRSLLKVKLSDRRGSSRSFVVPILDIRGSTIKISNPLGFLFLYRLVDYEVIPDYEMLVHEGIIGVACHPDVIDVKNKVSSQFLQLGNSTLDNNPEAATLQDDYNKLIDDLNNIYARLDGCIDLVDGQEPPFDDALDCLTSTQEDAVELLTDVITDLTDKLNIITARNTSASASTFDVDRNEVRADGYEVATITVAPRDVTGALILKNAPDGVESGVEIITDLGVVSEPQLQTTTGNVIATISSSIIGAASITVRINNELIVDSDGVDDPTTRIRIVNFVAEDILPTRRKRSKASGKTAINTGTTSEREPGNR